MDGILKKMEVEKIISTYIGDYGIMMVKQM